MSQVKRYYKPELDALRLFAFACVFVDHQPIRSARFKPFQNTGSYGLCLFFMLSAYLIVSILLRERANTGTVKLASFAVRRILRIWPLYFLVLFGGYGLGKAFWPDLMSGRAVVAFSFLLGNLWVIRHGWIGTALSPLWSLSIEEQFYLLIPALARWGASRAIAIVCLITVAFSYVVLAWLGPTQSHIWVNSFVQFQFFAAGGLIALWRYDRSWKVSSAVRCGLAVGGVGLWLAASFYLSPQTHVATTSVRLVLGFALIMAGTLAIFMAVLDVQKRIPLAITYLGKISYGLYIFHYILIVVVSVTVKHVVRGRSISFLRQDLFVAPLSLVLTIVAAAISYRYIEAPILRYKERFETVRTRGV